jgi:hypothetical protein
MRRPIDVRHTFGFAVRAMIFFVFSQAAPVAILLISSIKGVKKKTLLPWLVGTNRVQPYQFKKDRSFMLGVSWRWFIHPRVNSSVFGSD